MTGWITPGVAVRAFLSVIAALTLFLAAATTALHLVTPKPSWPWILTGLIIGSGLTALVTVRYGVLARYDKSWRDLGFIMPARAVLPLVWQIPLIILAAALVQSQLLPLLFGEGTATGQESVNDVIRSGISAPVLIAAFGIAVLTPLWEETLFRGFLFHALDNRLPLAGAIPLTGAGFALFHMLPPIMPFIFCLGMGAAWLTAHYRSLWPAVVLHAVNNGTLVAVMLSGGALPG